MARTNTQITQVEESVWQDFADKHDVIPHDQNNANLIERYFQETWPNDITVANLNLAWEQLKPHLKFYEPNQREFIELYKSLTESERAELGAWKGERGLKDSFYNGVLILTYVKAHGWPCDRHHLQLTIGQNSVAPRLEWEHVSTYAPSRHLAADDGTPFFSAGLVKQRDGSFGKSPLDYKREAREAAEKANPQPTPERQLSQSDQSWRRMRLDLLQYGNHARQYESKQLSDKLVQQGLPERQIYEQIKSLVDGWKRAEQMSNRAGYYSR